jgi:hypothetical protein
MATATRVAGERWQQQDRGQGDKGGGQAMATATKRAMATVTRVAGIEEGNDDVGKRDGNGNKGGERAKATRVMVMATRVMGEQRQ